METPPIYQVPKAGKPTNTVLIVVLVILGACLVCCLGSVIFMYWGFKKVGGYAGCTVNYAITLQAVQKYADAHNGILPPAKEWQEEISPYYDVEGVKKMKSFIPMGTPKGNLGCPAEGGSPATGMAYNKEVAGKKVSDITKGGNNPVILFESADASRDQCIPFKTPTGKSPQKVMGQPRDWLWIMWGGELHSGKNSRQEINLTG